MTESKVNSWAPVRRGRSIPSLDGLRAISVMLVVLSHLHMLPALASSSILGRSPTLGLMGVRVFFVISGYLITGLLTRELDESGTICLSRFYLRRTLRIFPAYYAMLGIVAWLGAHEAVNTSGAAWPALLTYTSNLGPTQPWILAHTWSLGVEEQFYLLWPAAVLVSGRRGALRLALFTMIALPIVRMLWFLAQHDGSIAFRAPEDFLAAGCALSLAQPALIVSRRCRAVLGFDLPLFVLPAVALYHWYFANSYGWRFLVDMLLGQSVCAVAIAAMVGWCIQRTDGWIGWVLNSKPLAVIGILSYSLYLWQQLAIRPGVSYSWQVAIALIVSCALLSYCFVERPGLLIRRRLEEWRENLASNSTAAVQEARS